MAILYHYSCIEGNPQQHWTEGETSWSKFQVDKYSGQHMYRPVKVPIPNAVKEVILPVFEKLGNQKFLECFKNKMSSKPNGAYHHVFGALAPKDC